MIVVFCIILVLLLLQEGPATDVLQTLRGVAQLNQTHGLAKPTQITGSYTPTLSTRDVARPFLLGHEGFQ